MSDFKVGDVVICIDDKNIYHCSKKVVIGSEYTVTGINNDVVGRGELFLGGETYHSYLPSRFKKKVQVFTKSMLKPGMRVVLRDKTVLVSSGVNLQDTCGKSIAALCYYKDDGIRTNSNTKYCDIMEVWSGPELVVDFFDMSKMGALLFKRVEKTEEELKKEAQLKDIAELEARLAELKAKINT